MERHPIGKGSQVYRLLTKQKAPKKIGNLWSEEEHGKFLESARKNGKNWAEIAIDVGSRTVLQVRAHAG